MRPTGVKGNFRHRTRQTEDNEAQVDASGRDVELASSAAPALGALGLNEGHTPWHDPLPRDLASRLVCLWSGSGPERN